MKDILKIIIVSIEAISALALMGLLVLDMLTGDYLNLCVAALIVLFMAVGSDICLEYEDDK